MINFVFEDLKNYRNFLSCTDVNPSTISRFAPAPIVISMLHRTQLAKEYKFENKPTNYIIATGVNHHPNDWTGSPMAYDNTRRSSFSYLSTAYLTDLQQGRAMIVFDQSLEGYQTPWLWQYFHDECAQYQVPAAAVIYVTGNVISTEQYTAWANSRNIIDRLNVIPYTHFETDIKHIARTTNLDLTFENQVEYKKHHTIRDYNCLQKRLRPHRIWFYKYLYDAGILDNGMVSMNRFELQTTWLEGKHIQPDDIVEYNKPLPLVLYGKNNNERDDRYYIDRVVPEVHLDTWVSVTSEASFADSDHTVFLSEKVFKPIVCYHPFIIMGNRGSLKKLRELGYKTFDGFIDESYDDLPTFERYAAIVESIKKVIAIKDKFGWYESMREILEHNYQTIMSKRSADNPAFYTLERCYKEYFK